MFRFNLGALAIAAALAAPLAASAQSAAPPAAVAPGAPVAPGVPAPGMHRHHHRRGGLMRAMRGLNLSPDQQQQIAGILKSARDARKNQTAPLDPQTRRANMMAMRRQIDGVLTDAQREQLATNLKNMRHMHKDGDAQRPQAPAPQ